MSATIKSMFNTEKGRLVTMRKIRKQMTAGIMAIICTLIGIAPVDSMLVYANETSIIENEPIDENMSENVDVQIDESEEVVEEDEEDDEDESLQIIKAMPIIQTQSSEEGHTIEASVDQNFMEWIINYIQDDVVLDWSILQGEKDWKRGSETLFNQPDDWEEYEVIDQSPYFDVEELEQPDGFTGLRLFIHEEMKEGNQEYFIRATLKGRYNDQDYVWVTTIPVEDDRIIEDSQEEEQETITEENEHSEDDMIPEHSEEKLDYSGELAMDADQTEEQEPIVVTVSGNAIEEVEEVEIQNDPSDTELIVEQDVSTEDNLIKISKISLPKAQMKMRVGNEECLSPTVRPEGVEAELEWKSDHPEIVSVNQEGVITALDEGTAMITVSCEDKMAQIQVIVEKSDAERNHDEPTDQEGNVIPISDDVWIAGFERESDSLIYTGDKVVQDLRIYHKDTQLKEKTDYTLTYRNNVNAADYNAAKAPSVTITMKGQYTGSRVLYYTILPKSIEEGVTAEDEQVMYYAKNVKIPMPIISFGTRKLTNKKDFICDYTTLPENYTKGESYEEGRTYTYQVNGIGNYTGSLTMQLSMIKNQNQDFGKASVTLDKKQYLFHGNALTTEDVQLRSVKIGKTILENTLYEYAVTAEAPGKGYVEVYPSEMGKEAGYRGKKKVFFTVVADRNIKNAVKTDLWQDSIVFSKDEVAEKGGICQKNADILCYMNEDMEENLVEGKDYTIRYSNHTKCGTATAIFTGMGRYTGTLKITYKILPKTDLYINWDDTNEEGCPVTFYQKDGAVPSFEVVERTEDGREIPLINKTDYTVTLKNNKKIGKMTCEINGKNNYRGYKNIAEVQVIAADISRGTMNVSDRAYSRKANGWKSAVSIKDVNGKQLKAGTDYDKQLIYTYPGMEEDEVPAAGTRVYVTAVGINNYAGSSITESYYIYSKHVNSLVITIDPQIYTGKEVTLSKDNIHVYLNQAARKKGEEIEEPCYRIVGYSNHIKVGNAKAILQGVGEYGGQRTCSFKINKKEYSNIRVKGISLEEKDILLGLGSSRQLTAVIDPEEAYNKTILWSSSNSKIATVTPDGVVTALKEGKVTIKAVSQDSGKSATCKVTVAVIRAESFVLNVSEIRQQEGTVYQLKALEIMPQEADGSTITWESTNEEVASMDGNGLVSLNKAGMAVIRAFTSDRKFEQRCMVYVENVDEKGYEGEYLTPQMFRSVKDSDDTRAFNEAVSQLDDQCNVLYVPAGIYQIDAETSIKLRSNMKLILSPDAVLKAINNSSRNYNIVCIDHVSNVTISGGQIQGERYGHDGSGGEWGMGIGVYDGRNINISNVKISDCWGDGIYLGSRNENNREAGCSGITISDCELFNNRRNNLSIVCADDVTIEGSVFRDANGTAPQYGIDIETNNSANPCERIKILDSVFEGNGSAAMGIVTNANDITISGCTLHGDFINYAGSNVVISNSKLLGETDARVGITMTDGTVLNDGSEEEDLLVANLKIDKKPYTIGQYNIDSSNQMSFATEKDEMSSSGIVLMLERTGQGTKESGYYFKLNELMADESSTLTKGKTYRFEYDIRGTGQWGIKTDQTGWYPCVPMEDKYATGIVTYTAGSGKNTRLMLYAVDKTKGMYLAVDEIRIYEIR